MKYIAVAFLAILAACVTPEEAARNEQARVESACRERGIEPNNKAFPACAAQERALVDQQMKELSDRQKEYEFQRKLDAVKPR